MRGALEVEPEATGSGALYTTAEAAARIGVSKNTLLRWLSDGRLGDVARDWRNWRVWNAADIARAETVRQQLHEVSQKPPPSRLKAAEAPLYAADMSRLAEGREYRVR